MTDKIPQIKIPCPACREPTTWRDNPFRPFCSESCRSHDLGNWATERYRIPVHESPEEEVEKALAEKVNRTSEE